MPTNVMPTLDKKMSAVERK